jgi:hypothetical protein
MSWDNFFRVVADVYSGNIKGDPTPILSALTTFQFNVIVQHQRFSMLWSFQTH